VNDAGRVGVWRGIVNSRPETATHPIKQMPRTKYFIRVNGMAASRDMSHGRAMKAADQARAARPDAVISLVQVDPDTLRPCCESVLFAA